MAAVVYVVGPAGSGKTSLIHRLMAGYEAEGRKCVCIEESTPGGRAETVAKHAAADVIFLERYSAAAADTDADPKDLRITLTSGSDASRKKFGAPVSEGTLDVTNLLDFSRRVIEADTLHRAVAADNTQLRELAEALGVTTPNWTRITLVLEPFMAPRVTTEANLKDGTAMVKVAAEHGQRRCAPFADKR